MSPWETGGVGICGVGNDLGYWTAASIARSPSFGNYGRRSAVVAVVVISGVVFTGDRGGLQAFCRFGAVEEARLETDAASCLRGLLGLGLRTFGHGHLRKRLFKEIESVDIQSRNGWIVRLCWEGGDALAIMEGRLVDNSRCIVLFARVGPLLRRFDPVSWRERGGAVPFVVIF
jgi:hypothetical protein